MNNMSQPKSFTQAFDLFKSNLEISKKELDLAIKLHEIVSDALIEGKKDQTFLMGSYKRNTKIRPLNDVDMVLWLSKSENKVDLKTLPAPNSYLGEIVHRLNISKIEDIAEICKQDHSVRIDFKEAEFGIEVVPGFGLKSDPEEAASSPNQTYKIPQRSTGNWIKTNPRSHETLLTNANDKSNERIVPLIKMIKKFNQMQEKDGHKPLQSFHIEALTIHAIDEKASIFQPTGLVGPLIGLSDYIYSILKNKKPTSDPSGIGPNVTDYLYDKNGKVKDGGRYDYALKSYKKLNDVVGEAVEAAIKGNLGDSISKLHNIFGNEFPKPPKQKSSKEKDKEKKKKGTKMSPDAPNKRFG